MFILYLSHIFCLLQAIKVLRSGEYAPFIVFIAAPTLPAIHQVATRIHTCRHHSSPHSPLPPPRPPQVVVTPDPKHCMTVERAITVIIFSLQRRSLTCGCALFFSVWLLFLFVLALLIDSFQQCQSNTTAACDFCFCLFILFCFVLFCF